MNLKVASILILFLKVSREIYFFAKYRKLYHRIQSYSEQVIIQIDGWLTRSLITIMDNDNRIWVISQNED